ncbi:unnamed protein product [Bemisia tabaci]|uniref:Bromodomain adjacent to zinc finger domain protein 1A n=1 Tax=Bemisia tabaci TaxID=7038 RepID=A0A9P0A7X1_BEMTA|nr:PREDICTED: bromodomain adjacent to zinc finger domain protein 1A isoform X2 [Bemisia tabaci]CAH0385775.1 unnamed protein product [Bemisia tabaci]
MPLLHKKPFNPNRLPKGLSDDEEVFLCELTSEVFRDYEEFCERIILCNSLVWSCSLTGKANLTYKEAKACEENAKKTLKEFPMELRIPVLYLATLTQRSSLNELAEDVFSYVKNHYFIGETVEVLFPEDKWIECHVIQVTEPTAEELSSYGGTKKIGERQFWPPCELFHYEVEQLDSSGEDSVFVISASQVKRRKGVYTRDKNRLYIKQFFHQVGSTWKLKEEALSKYGISRVKFDQIFVGDPPQFYSPKKKRTPTNALKANGKKGQESIEKYLSKVSKFNPVPNSGEPKKPREPKQTAEQQQAAIEELKKKRLEEKMKAKEKKREEKVKLAKFMKEWNKRRDDLELEDLKELPAPHPVQLRLPNEYFGDLMMILEFLYAFNDTVSVRDYFPGDITLELVERALTEKEIAGPLSDLVQMLLGTIFTLQEDEDDEVQEMDKEANPEPDDLKESSTTIAQAIKAATAAAGWSQMYHGTHLNKLTMDPNTLSEVLRLHLLASGGRAGEMSSKWRYQQRGGYKSTDDPGLTLRIEKPHILQALSRVNMCELSLEDKITILKCLIDQILTFSAVRDIIDERLDKNKQNKLELKNFQAANIKQEREAALKLKAKKDALKNLPGDQPLPPEEPESPENSEKQEKELAKRRQEIQKKVREISEGNMGCQLLPLGLDRAYRRFWLFSSVPGLFVEHNELYAGPCLPKGTPVPDYNLINNEDTYTYIRKLFEEGSDKENLGNRASASGSPSKKLLVEKNGGADESQIGNVSRNEKPCCPLTCWGDPATCPVHCLARPPNHTYWAFYKDENDINLLIDTLNNRGFREHDLKQVLMQEKERIVQSITNCPVNKLDSSLGTPIVEPRKSSRKNATYENANYNAPENTPIDKIMESFLRDTLVEMEENIHAGCLGSLKVHDRLKWRDALCNGSYDQQSDRLEWGPKTNLKVKTEMEIKDEPMDWSPSEDMYLNSDVKMERLSVIRSLASAILQIEQALEPKYLKRPLGLDEKEKERQNKEKQKDGEQDKESDEKPKESVRERWEMALMNSTSISQLFLHLQSLDNSIQWTRSALNAYCRLCRRRGDPEKMLLCDKCDKGHHMYCLKPKLVKVPQGDWFCPRCKPKEKPQTPVKKSRRIFDENETDEEMDEDDEEEEEEEEEDAGGEDEDYEEEVKPKRKSIPVGKCKGCGNKGELASCSKCSAGYHLKCAQPVLRKHPTSKWTCHKCKSANAYSNSNFKKGNEPSEMTNGTSSRRRSRRSYEQAPPMSNNLPLDNAVLQELLDVVMHHEDAWPFLRPVTKGEVPDYHLIIKRPMDFGTIKHKLNMLEYRLNSELISDALLVFENCFLYNESSSEVYQAGVRLRKFFDRLCKERNLHVPDDCPKAPPAKKVKTVY